TRACTEATMDSCSAPPTSTRPRGWTNGAAATRGRTCGGTGTASSPRLAANSPSSPNSRRLPTASAPAFPPPPGPGGSASAACKPTANCACTPRWAGTPGSGSGLSPTLVPISSTSPVSPGIPLRIGGWWGPALEAGDQGGRGWGAGPSRPAGRGLEAGSDQHGDAHPHERVSKLYGLDAPDRGEATV